MVAVLRPIAVKPVTRPVYRRHDLLDFPASWIRENHDLLVEWFGQSPQEDFESFAKVQWEIECNQHDAFKDTYRGP